MSLRSLETERSQRHADLRRAMTLLQAAVNRSGPPPKRPADETNAHREARAAARSYAERWDLFKAADDAYEREVLELNRSVARHPAGGRRDLIG